MAPRQEPGMFGEVYSLAGLKGVKNRGRQVDTKYLTFAPTTGDQIIGSNSNRIAAIFQNSPASAGNISIALGDISTGSDYTCTLTPGQSFQIDYAFPWTGVVVGYALAGGCSLFVTEISVP